jgi:diguanylate cyclase (GGDEF)-like protein
MAPIYIYASWIFTKSLDNAFLWLSLVFVLSLFGYKLHKDYTAKNLNLQEKDDWFLKARLFLFSYFSMWTIMFITSVDSNIVQMHYIAVAAQLGIIVVSATLLVSQRALALFTLASLTVPLVIYFILIGEFYSYLLVFFSLVMGGVLTYSTLNTNRYIEKSRFQAYNDYLTHLGNRHFFIELLQDSINSQEKYQEYSAIILLDLDNFKTVNDSLGHDIGDMLLIEVAKRIQELCIDHYAYAARLGGDEFCILTPAFRTNQECVESTMELAKELLYTIKNTYNIEENSIYISASMGISIIDNPDIDANTFLKEADIAMYESKLHGRNRFMFFNKELSDKANKKLEIDRLLHFALTNDEIYLMYQPQVNANSNIVGCEVLVRWNNEVLGFVPPDAFIPIAETSGFVLQLGRYILEESFKTFKEWSQKGINLEQFSINISMKQILHASFVEEVQSLVKKYLNASLCSKLIFEITETSVAEDVEKLIATMHELQKLGIKFSMDDFGTGYSSLSYLQKLPIYELKIDQSFLVHLDGHEQNKTMVLTILSIAKALKLSVVAEGVEHLSQKEFLVENNCDILQGYLFSKPVLKEDFMRLLL